MACREVPRGVMIGRLSAHIRRASDWTVIGLLSQLLILVKSWMREAWSRSVLTFDRQGMSFDTLKGGNFQNGCYGPQAVLPGTALLESAPVTKTSGVFCARKLLNR
jgi:hypothetical protein